MSLVYMLAAAFRSDRSTDDCNVYQRPLKTWCRAAVVDGWGGLWWVWGGREAWMMGCERRVGRRRGVNYFKNKLLSVSGLFFHFLYCLGSCFLGIVPAWRYSLGPLMKYSPGL